MPSRRAASDSVSALREDFAKLRADIEDLARTAGGYADGTADRLYEGAREAAAGLGRRAEGAYDDALERGRETLRTAEGTVRSHPLASLAAAAALGWLIAKLTSRR